jgi:hypothetical protein
VINPQSKLLGRVPIPEDYVTNLAFGGPGRKTLYLTAGTSVYKFPVTASRNAVYPPLRPRDGLRPETPLSLTVSYEVKPVP